LAVVVEVELEEGRLLSCWREKRAEATGSAGREAAGAGAGTGVAALAGVELEAG